MTTATYEPRARVASRRPGLRYPITEARTVEVDVFTDTDAHDVSTGMRSFAPTRGVLRYVRQYLGAGTPEATWGDWHVTVTLSGPRRLSSGALSDRTVCEATFREGARNGSTLTIPSYLRALVDEHRPAGDPT